MKKEVPNFRFFKEKVKKFKIVIVLLLTIIPIITLLNLMLEGSKNSEVLMNSDIVKANIIGMYIIPILLSLTLFGYIYKKSNTDSQSVSRKTIFITNTIGGIFLITIMQILVAIVLLLFKVFSTNMIIFTQMIFDMFVVMWLSYVFVFLVANIGMCLAGNAVTQVIITILILFLVPFCTRCCANFKNYDTYNLENENGTYKIYVKEDEQFTMPYQILYMVSSSNYNIYVVNSMVKTAILGVIYYFIGLKLFCKKEVEITGESFKREKIHLFIKALTIIPIIFFINSIDDEIKIFIFTVVIIGIYYFVYDFIVREKIKLGTSIIGLIITIIASQILYFSSSAIYEYLNKKNIALEDIKAIQIEGYHLDGKYIEYIADLNITSQNTIRTIFNNIYIDYSEDESEDTQEVFLVSSLEMKNGKKLKLKSNVQMKIEDFYDVLDTLEEDTELVNEVKSSLQKDGEYIFENNRLEGEEKELFKTEFENKVKESLVNELVKEEYFYDNRAVSYYTYQNHKLQKTYILENFTVNILNFVASKINNENYNKIKEIVNKEEFVMRVTTSEDVYDFDYIESEELVKCMSDCIEMEFDPNQEYYIICINNNYLFYTNKLEELYKLIEKEKQLEIENESIYE